MILRLLLGAVIGGGLGFALYRFVGCSSGACPLTSNPIISTIYGSILGALFASSVRCCPRCRPPEWERCRLMLFRQHGRFLFEAEGNTGTRPFFFMVLSFSC